MEMDIKENVLKLGMVAENGTAKELLLSHVHDLREALHEQGIKIDKIDIQINYNFEQSLADSKEGLEEGWKRMKGFRGRPLLVDDEIDSHLTGRRIMSMGDRLLDLVA